MNLTFLIGGFNDIGLIIKFAFEWAVVHVNGSLFGNHKQGKFITKTNIQRRISAEQARPRLFLPHNFERKGGFKLFVTSEIEKVILNAIQTNICALGDC